MNHESNSREPLLAAFAHTMREATGSTLNAAQTSSYPSDVDAIGVLETPEGTWPLVFAIKKDVYPRDVKDAMWNLQGYASRMENPSDAVLVLLAEHLSKGAREELRQRNMSYFDSNGTLFFKHRNWLINIERAKTSAKDHKREMDVFKGARESVIHTLLCMKRDWFHGQDVVEMSKTSGFTVSTVLQELERFGWVESQGEGRHRLRRLIKPSELLDAWAKAWVERKQLTSRWYYFCPDPKRLVKDLALDMDVALARERDAQSGRHPNSVNYAFTGAIAANRLTPLLTHVDTAEIVVSSNADDLAVKAGLKPAEKGANVILIERSGASDLFKEYVPEDEAWFTSPFIQYLDLLNGRGRNAELAAQLRSQILGM